MTRPRRPALPPTASYGSRPRTPRSKPAPESTVAGVLVHNPFLRLPVEQALDATNLSLFQLESALAPHPVLRVVVADVDELGPRATDTVSRWHAAGTVVLVFGRPAQAPALRALQSLGALAAERTTFLTRLPELLALALGRQVRHPRSTTSNDKAL